MSKTLYEQQMALCAGWTETRRDVKADREHAVAKRPALMATVAQLEEQVRNGVRHKEVRDELQAAQTQRDELEREIADYRTREDDLARDIGRVEGANKRAGDCRVRSGLKQDEFEKVFELYFKNGFKPETLKQVQRFVASVESARVATAQKSYGFNSEVPERKPYIRPPGYADSGPTPGEEMVDW